MSDSENYYDCIIFKSFKLRFLFIKYFKYIYYYILIFQKILMRKRFRMKKLKQTPTPIKILKIIK